MWPSSFAGSICAMTSAIGVGGAVGVGLAVGLAGAEGDALALDDAVGVGACRRTTSPHAEMAIASTRKGASRRMLTGYARPAPGSLVETAGAHGLLLRVRRTLSGVLLGPEDDLALLRVDHD